MFPGSLPLLPRENPFSAGGTGAAGAQGAASTPQVPMHFRRHGSAEQGYGGNLGLTPPGTPPRSRNGSPRNSPRAGTRRDRSAQAQDDEPPPRRDRSRENANRERESSTEANEVNTSMPAEWGARTLRLEKMVQESAAKITELHNMVTELQTKVGGDNHRLNAIESALPERISKCEERQAGHSDIVSQLGRNAHEQISTLQHRMNTLEQLQSSIPSFGGGARRNAQYDVTSPQNFNIGSPVAGQVPAPEPSRPVDVPQTHVPQNQPNVPIYDPWTPAQPNQR